jgi:hypothetical protein
MKQTLFYLILNCVLVLNSLNAQVNYGTRTLPSFSQVVPNLKLLPSGYPDTVEANAKTDFYYQKDVKKGSYKFSGTVISSDDIKKKIGLFMITSDAAVWKDDTLVHGVKQLMIYSDSLVLKENLWFPGADIVIQTRVLNTNGFNINSSGLSWETGSNYKLVSETDKYYGANGGKAGNITLTVEKVEGTGKLMANGGNGASVFVPAVTIKYPQGTVKELTVHSNQGCSDKTENKEKIEFKFDNDVIAAVCETINDKWHTWASYDCFSYPIYDGNNNEVGFGTKNGQNSNIYDTKATERLTFKRQKPGESGSNGVITISSPLESIIAIENKKGKTGQFLGRTKDDYADYGKERDTLDKIPTINYKDYSLVYARAPFFNNNDPNLRFKEQRTIGLIRIPSDAALSTYKNFIDSVKTKFDTTKAEAKINKIAYYPHPDYLSNRLDYLKSQYFVYYRKTDAQKKGLDTEIDSLTAALSRLADDTQVNSELKSEYTLLHIKATHMSNYRTRNIDEFGNVPGYRPMFSLKTTMEYMENNLRTDLRLFVMSDILANDETQAKKFIDKVPTLINALKERNRELSKKLETANLAFDVIQKKALPCALLTDTLKEKLVQLEKKFLKQAEKDAEIAKWGKIGIKIAAVGLSCIPYGQPALGQVGGSILNSVADNIEEPLGTIVQNAVAKVDMSETLKEMAKKDVKKKEGKAPELDYNKVYQRLELSGDRILTALEKKAEESAAAYKEKVNKLNKGYNESFETMRGFATSMMANSASSSDLQKRVAQMQAISYEFADISRDLTIQNNLKQEIFSKLNDALQNTGDIQVEMFQNAQQIVALQSQVGKTEYSEDLEEAVKGIRNAALNRLQWIEYQMIKSYEYTTMAPYAQRMPCATILQTYYDRAADKKTIENVEPIVEELAVAYIAQRQDMGSKIMSKLDLTKYKADVGFNRKIILASSKNSALKTEHLLSDLNTKETLVLDLQNDFINEIIRPDEAQTRIKDIKLESIEFEEPLLDNASFKIKLEILDEGIMREGTNFYLFKTGSLDSIADTWKWDVKKNVKGEVDIKSTRNSDEISNLVSFLATGKNGDNEKISRYTAPPAWSRCRISIDNAQDGTVPKVKYLELGLKCDNYELPINDNHVVLDVRCENAPSGILFSSKINSKEDTHISNYYTAASRNASVTLHIDASVRKHFVKWQIIKKKEVLDKTEEEITFNLDRHTRVIAIFEEEKASNSGNLAAAEVTSKSVTPEKAATDKANHSKKIKIYESPYTDAPVLREVDDSSHFTPIKDSEQDGFQRVLFNETQEGYILIRL